MVINDIMCMPVYRFLHELHPDKGLAQKEPCKANDAILKA